MKNRLIKFSGLFVATCFLAGAASPTASVNQRLDNINDQEITNFITPNSFSQQLIPNRAINYNAFITEIGLNATKLGKQYGLFPSVMVAQAILESGWGQSDLAKEANNLFGIKGDYNGAFVTYPTQEYDKITGNWLQIEANFRKYPNYYASQVDNAEKLRGGVTWDTQYYNGTWIENAKNYSDATAWLTGRYATDPNYNKKLNQLILNYDLTKFDSVNELIVSNSSINRKARVKNTNQFPGIYEKNGNYFSWKRDNTSYEGQDIQVTQVAKTASVTYYYIKQIEGNAIGWIMSQNLSIYDDLVIEQAINNQYGKMQATKYSGIYKGPWNTYGATRIGDTSKIINQD
ncbi:glucosaminidase domain-containing protein, partial [Enterococcus gallinarum]